MTAIIFFKVWLKFDTHLHSEKRKPIDLRQLSQLPTITVPESLLQATICGIALTFDHFLRQVSGPHTNTGSVDAISRPTSVCNFRRAGIFDACVRTATHSVPNADWKWTATCWNFSTEHYAAWKFRRWPGNGAPEFTKSSLPFRCSSI